METARILYCHCAYANVVQMPPQHDVFAREARTGSGHDPDNVVRRVGQLSYVTVPRRCPRTWNFGSGRFSESSFKFS